MLSPEASLEARAGPTRVVVPPPPPPDIDLTPSLLDFDIVSELGEGAQGRVFLARQKSLADRPVVLKVSSRRGKEHLSLARLQHTHIVPLYWQQDDVAEDRRVLCMPFFGTLTLDALLIALQNKRPFHRTGQDILEALDKARDAAAVKLPAQLPGRDFLKGASYVGAVCWIGACLADALHYAHERGLVHLDLKPSNVLIAGDGQPMLLDFHLAREPIAPGDIRPRGMGGTPLYMAPEQRAAMDAAMHRQPVPQPVDGRADVYALGLLLYQALGGPIAAPVFPALERLNRDVSPGLSDILAHCLQANPEKRYPSAAALAEDLRQHLSDQPLIGVANRSWRERWTKWRRRRPQALLILSLSLLLVMGSVISGWYVYQGRHARREARIAQIERCRESARKESKDGRFTAAVASLQQAVAVAEEDDALASWREKVRGELQTAKRDELFDLLRGLADSVRLAAGSLDRPRDWTTLEANCQRIWDERHNLLQLTDLDKEPNKDSTVRRDLLDVVLMWIDVRTREAPLARVTEYHQTALATLEEAEKLLGVSAVSLHQKKGYAVFLGERDKVLQAETLIKRTPPRSGWDFFALGRFYLRADALEKDTLEKAAGYFDEAVARMPEAFWPNFYQGHCAYRLGKYAEAASAFRAAIVAEPRQPAVYHNRGLAYLKMGPDMEARARADFEKALELDPSFKAAQEQLDARWRGRPAS